MASISSRINLYLFTMMIAICISTFVTESIVIVWIINLVGLFLIFLPYFKSTNFSLLFLAISYLFFGVFTFLVNLGYLSDDLKSIGTNINILIFPTMLLIAYSVKTRNSLDKNSIVSVLKFLSILGTISVAFAWAMGASDILSVFSGMSAYQARVYGIFYSKNIYGAFVGLTMAADLYLLSEKRRLDIMLLLGIKFIAVIVSFSRAALLQTVVMIFIFYCLKNKRKLIDYVLLFIAALAIIFIIYLILADPDLTNFFMNSVFRVQGGDAGRAMLRERALSLIPDDIIHILLGVGFPGVDALKIDVDNTYLYLWFTGGFPKVFAYLSAAIYSLYKIIKLKSQDTILYRICISIFISYLFFAFFESVAFLELGLLNFVYTFFLFYIPMGYYSGPKSL